MIELRYFLWDVFAWFDRVFGITHYWERQSSDFELAQRNLSYYIERLIYYFEGAPLSESKKNIEVMQRWIERANKHLRDINFKPTKLLEDVADDIWIIFDDGWKGYCDCEHLNPSKKNWFDITSAEIRHLLYEYDCANSLLWSDLFLVLEIKQGKVQVRLDVDALEMRRHHEEEFNVHNKPLK